MTNSIPCGSSDETSYSCVLCPQRPTTLFSELSTDELDRLNKQRYTVNYKKGEVIFKSGTKPAGLLCLHEGKVKISRTGPAGNDQIIALRKNGDFIGLRALIKNDKYVSTAVALDDTSVCIIPNIDFREVLEENPELSLRITNYFIEKLEDTEQLHINHSQKHMRGRMADALLQINKIYGMDEETGYLNVSLKRAEIASLANMTQANAIRILSAFASEDLLELQRRNIKLKNIPALQFLSVSGR